MKKRKYKRKNRRTTQEKPGDEILKQTNPAELANPMMGLAAQVEKDMFQPLPPGHVTKVFLESVKDVDSKKPEPTQLPSNGTSEDSYGCEILQIIGFLAIGALIVFGVYKAVTYSAYHAGECYKHKYEKTTFSRINRVYDGLKEVDYDYVDGAEFKIGSKNRDQDDFAGLYEEQVDCSRYFWMQNLVYLKK